MLLFVNPRILPNLLTLGDVLIALSDAPITASVPIFGSVLNSSVPIHPFVPRSYAPTSASVLRSLAPGLACVPTSCVKLCCLFIFFFAVVLRVYVPANPIV